MPCEHSFDGWCLACVKKLVDENFLLRERLFKKAVRENPLSVLAKLHEFIALPLDCGHSIDCWDDEKEICELCETRKENLSFKEKLKELKS